MFLVEDFILGSYLDVDGGSHFARAHEPRIRGAARREERSVSTRLAQHNSTEPHLPLRPVGPGVPRAEHAPDAYFTEIFQAQRNKFEVRDGSGPEHIGGFATGRMGPSSRFVGATITRPGTNHLTIFKGCRRPGSPRPALKEADFPDFDGLSPLLLTCKFIILNYNFSTASP
jgi:hypothetical protein